jgi:hypothetical protein
MTPSDVLLERPTIIPPLDPEFRPVSWGQQRYAAVVEQAADRVPVTMALERHEGMVSVFRTEILPLGGSHDAATARYLERQVKVCFGRSAAGACSSAVRWNWPA